MSEHRAVGRRRTLLRGGSTAAVMTVAAGTRLWNLGHPHELVFDETYYVKDSWTLWQLGYEGSWADGANAAWAAGDASGWSADPAFIAHPPLGKWIIGLGMAMLGPESSWAWRITTALVGIALVALTMVAAQVLFRAWPLTVIAGGLLAIDGTAIVMSRVALLDTHLAALMLVGFIFVVLDRRWIAVRYRAWSRAPADTRAPRSRVPVYWWRPWLFAAGVALGAAGSVKWSGFYLLALLGIVTVISDATLAHRSGATSWPRVTLRQAPINALLMVPIAGIVHLVAWTGWFATTGGYGRNRLADDPSAEGWTGALSWVPPAFQNWWHYQSQVLDFHSGLSSEHSYASPAWQWPLLIRPTSMWYHAENGTAAEILQLGNPLIWWGTTAALLAVVGISLHRLVHRAPVASTALLLAGVAGSYLPWFLYPERTMFSFYVIAAQPFLMIALAYGLYRAAFLDEATRAERRIGAAIVATFLIAAIVLSVYFWPIWSGAELPEAELRMRFWFRSWI